MQDQTIVQLLLQEFRAFRDTEFHDFRDDVSAWRQETGERVAVLESEVKSGLKGNGQPSRMTKAEDRITALERAWWKIVGACAAVWALLTVVLHFVPWGKH